MYFHFMKYTILYLAKKSLYVGNVDLSYPMYLLLLDAVVISSSGNAWGRLGLLGSPPL